MGRPGGRPHLLVRLAAPDAHHEAVVGLGDVVGGRSGYGAHSLRAGLITSAVEAGAHERDVMRHSRHKSVAVFRGYVRHVGLFQENAGDGVGIVRVGVRWPWAPLEEAIGGGTWAGMAAVLGVHERQIGRWKQYGLTDESADRCAINAGLHPAKVWGPAWDDDRLGFDLEEVA